MARGGEDRADKEQDASAKKADEDSVVVGAEVGEKSPLEGDEKGCALE